MAARKAWLEKFQLAQKDREARAAEAKRIAEAEAKANVARAAAADDDGVGGGVTVGHSRSAWEAAAARAGGSSVLLTLEGGGDLFGADGRLKQSGDDGDDDAVFQVAGAADDERRNFYAHLKRKVKESRESASGAHTSLTSDFTEYKAGRTSLLEGEAGALHAGDDGGFGGDDDREDQSWREGIKTASEYAPVDATVAAGALPKKKKKKPIDAVGPTAAALSAPGGATTAELTSEEAARIAEARAEHARREALRRKLAAAAALPPAEAGGARGSGAAVGTAAPETVPLSGIPTESGADDADGSGGSAAAEARARAHGGATSTNDADAGGAAPTRMNISDTRAGFSGFRSIDDPAPAAPTATDSGTAVTAAAAAPVVDEGPADAVAVTASIAAAAAAAGKPKAKKGPSAMTALLAMAKGKPVPAESGTVEPVLTAAPGLKRGRGDDDAPAGAPPRSLGRSEAFRRLAGE